MKNKSFEIAIKKGDLGEQIIQQYFEDRGWIIYKPVQKDTPHYFDMLLTKDKKKLMAVDVKTKARLNKWNAQGINISHYNDYMRFTAETNIPFFIVFIDDKSGDIHTAEITKLKDPIYINSYIIAWDLNQMFRIHQIDPQAIRELSQLDQRTYEYDPK